MLSLLLIPSAFALSLSLESEDTPWPGITVREYRASSPSTDVFVTLVDLCTDEVYVEATRYTGSFYSTRSWADDVGVQVATNGDFYKSSPTRIYGDAVGDGVRWLSVNTGLDSDYSGEWYYQDYGWIAFGHDWVEFNHTKWVKNNAADFGGLAEGWDNATIGPEPPPGTLSLVSGFPELVIEGVPIDCSSPTASDCFPDRSDMRDRHPRTAMGLTADRQTLILAVVDGRTSSNSGMYGEELASLMYQLGAHVAFNLDGGGSSQMVVDGSYINDYDGNNYGSGARSVANHWGVRAGGGSGLAERPGHCASAAPCGTIPPAGTIIDTDSPCTRLFGNLDTWRPVSAGYGGQLYWTNVWETDLVDNWVWWQLYFEEEGDYLVEFWAESGYSQYPDTKYKVLANGVLDEFTVDQGAGTGWQPVGTWRFAAGGGQYMALYDDSSSLTSSDRKVTADAIRLTRVGVWCGDAACGEGEDCSTCAEDCTGPEELPDNGIDDDCDGLIDPVEELPDSGLDSGLPSGEGGDGGPDGGAGSDGAGADGSEGAGTDGADGSEDADGAGQVEEGEATISRQPKASGCACDSGASAAPAALWGMLALLRRAGGAVPGRRGRRAR